MRIGTWNVEYAAGAEKNRLRRRRLAAMSCDVWVLTETHDDLALGEDFQAVSTTQRLTGRPGGRWTTLWTRFPIRERLAVEDPNRTVAALLDTPVGPLVVYGTVLPWGRDPGPSGAAEGWSEHHRVIPLQAREWAELRRAHPTAALCVAGDFNTNLGGPHYYGTAKGRRLLGEGLDAAGLECVTTWERVGAGRLRYPAIDHVCLSAPLAVGARVSDVWEGTDGEGRRLSDHAGLVVDVRGTTPRGVD